MHHQKDVASSSKVEPCDICGDVGFSELIVTCSECNINCEHRYCTRVHHIEVPEVWFCEPCESKNTTTSPCKVNQDIGLQAPKRQETARIGKVKFLDEDEVIKLSSGNILMTRKAYVGSKNVVPKIPLPTVKSNPCISPAVHGKLQRNEAQKNQMTDQHASHPSSKGAVVQCHRSNIEKSNIQSIPENFQHYHKHLPSSVCAWRGQFQVLQAAASGEVYDGFEAQPPCVVNRKAHEISNKMPSVLQLEALPASNVLTNVFPNDPPSLQDIALYFFPSDSNERSRKNLNSIFELMNAEQSMLRSFIDGVELLVLTSSQLNEDSRVYSEHFLWGIYRQNKIDNAIEGLSDLVEPIDMDVDMIGGKDVLERMDHVQNENLRSLSQWSFEETPLQKTSSVKVKIENNEIPDVPRHEHRKKVSFGISANPPLRNPAKAKEYQKFFDIPDLPPGFEHGRGRVKPPKYKRLDELK